MIKKFLSFLLLTSPLFGFSQTDSIRVAVGAEYDQVSNLHRFLFGENYRKAWATPVWLKILDLKKEKGGLQVVKLGGGMQTQSLRLVDVSGRTWVLRTLQKYPERALPPGLKKTIAKDILQDQVSTTNPFSALTVPKLASAIQIPHSNPQIVYVADDPGLGEYRKDFANRVYLFEEREPENSIKTDNTEKVIAKLKEDNDVSIDQKIVLRARLLDMLIGDWDRHEDQWRWDKVKTNGKTIYTPVPRDRDQVYYRTSGVFPWIVSHQWLKSKFQPYKTEIRDVNGWNFNARYFDRFFLNGLSEADWVAQIDFVQQQLTDEVIRRAMQSMPPEIYRISGKELAEIFIARRNNLKKQALSYYRFISIYVDVTASDKHERFVISNQGDGSVAIEIQKTKKDGALDGTIYQRVFDPSVTKEVRLYGFEGKDGFEVSGITPSPIKIRMIGGPGSDRFKIDPELKNKSNLYVYEREDQENILPSNREAKVRLSGDSAVNTFNRTAFVYDRSEVVVLADYNNDYGISLITGYRTTKQGFRKTPYASRNEFLVKYSTVRHSFLIDYAGDWKKAIGKNDLSINISSHGPNNVSNFFGIGNESIFKEGNNAMDYFRNRYDYVNAEVALGRNLGKFRLSAGIDAQFYNSATSNNGNKFLNNYNALNTEENVFDVKWYAGVSLRANLDTRNNLLQPTKGVVWRNSLKAVQQIGDEHNTYGQFSTEFSGYFNPDRDSVLVVANRTAFGTTIGRAAFFQQMKVGGPQTLRGYHTWRFTGNTMFYNNLEVRLKLLDFNSYLFPGKIGVLGFHDIGRVWSPGQFSQKWHNGYGGGVYFSPADLILIQGAVGFSEESTLYYINFGFRF
ncbi:BamA/TamA family outer membrane protein [Pedobacter sp.]|uniref:BamA/TamA family outer membrane protein n=1 Tax=Pedobacter sp. TaxID=1411316 RepID=UPI003BA88B84